MIGILRLARWLVERHDPDYTITRRPAGGDYAIPDGVMSQLRWRQSVIVWAMWADPRWYPDIRAGRVPSAARMTAASGGGIDWRYWTAITDLLAAVGVVEKQPSRPTCWAHGYHFRRLAREVRLGQIDLPYPTGAAAPAPHYRGQLTGRDGRGRVMVSQEAQ